MAHEIRRSAPGPRPRVDGEYGIAVLMILACLAVLMPFTASFNYQARIDWQSAVNVRDEVAARNVERGGLRLSVLLFELQRMVFNQRQFRDFMGTWDITQVAPYLMSVFGTSDGAEGLGSFIGLDTTGLKGLGLEHGSFEVRLEAESGKMNVNCLAAPAKNNDSPAGRTAETIEALTIPVLYNPLFEEEKADGYRYTREDTIAALTDYVDDDNKRFDVIRLEPSATTENYRYQQLWDPYEMRNARLDTVDEVQLAEGIDDDWMMAFGAELTVYGECKTNLNFASADQIALVLRHAVAQADRWKTEGESFVVKTMPLANFIVQMRELRLFQKLDDFKEMAAKPDEFMNPAMLMGANSGVRPTAGTMNSMRHMLGRIPEGIEVRIKGGAREDGSRWGGLEEVATVAPERVYRVEVIAEVGAVKKRLTAVYDMQYARTQSQGKGAWLYYRED